jgi:hypothetical protein
MTSHPDYVSEDFRLSQLGIEVAEERVIRCTHSTATSAAQRECHRVAREGLETGNRQYVESGCADVAKYNSALAALGFAYLLDVVLVGVVAEYLAEQNFPGVGWLSAAARYSIPLALIGVENAIGAHIYEVDRQAGGRTTSTGRVWRLLGVLWALMTPLIVFGAQAVLHPHAFRSSWQGESWLMLGVVFVAFALHMFVLFGGELNRMAQGYALFALRRAFHRWRERWHEARRRRAGLESVVAFRVYASRLRSHAETHGETVYEGLPRAVLIVLEEIGAGESGTDNRGRAELRQGS